MRDIRIFVQFVIGHQVSKKRRKTITGTKQLSEPGRREVQPGVYFPRMYAIIAPQNSKLP